MLASVPRGDVDPDEDEAAAAILVPTSASPTSALLSGAFPSTLEGQLEVLDRFYAKHDREKSGDWSREQLYGRIRGAADAVRPGEFAEMCSQLHREYGENPLALPPREAKPAPPSAMDPDSGVGKGKMPRQSKAAKSSKLHSNSLLLARVPRYRTKGKSTEYQVLWQGADGVLHTVWHVFEEFVTLRSRILTLLEPMPREREAVMALPFPSSLPRLLRSSEKMHSDNARLLDSFMAQLLVGEQLLRAELPRVGETAVPRGMQV